MQEEEATVNVLANASRQENAAQDSVSKKELKKQIEVRARCSECNFLKHQESTHFIRIHLCNKSDLKLLWLSLIFSKLLECSGNGVAT